MTGLWQCHVGYEVSSIQVRPLPAYSAFRFQRAPTMKILLLIFCALHGAMTTQVPAGHKYIAPGPTDERSPCPGLNSVLVSTYQVCVVLTLNLLLVAGQSWFVIEQSLIVD